MPGLPWRPPPEQDMGGESTTLPFAVTVGGGRRIRRPEAVCEHGNPAGDALDAPRGAPVVTDRGIASGERVRRLHGQEYRYLASAANASGTPVCRPSGHGTLGEYLYGTVPQGIRRTAGWGSGKRRNRYRHPPPDAARTLQGPPPQILRSPQPAIRIR